MVDKEKHGAIDPDNASMDAKHHALWDAVAQKHPEVAIAIAGIVNGLPVAVGLSALATVATNVLGMSDCSEDELCSFARCFARYIHVRSHDRYDDIQESKAQAGEPNSRPN